MSDIKLTLEDFKALAPERLSFLGQMGFSRVVDLELTTPTHGTIVFVGKYVGFEFSFDVRDECVDVEVVKMKDGKLWPNSKGGYSSSVSGYLIKHEGYRGGGRTPGGDKNIVPKTSSELMGQKIDAETYCLKNFGQSLLRDRPDSLPA